MSEFDDKNTPDVSNSDNDPFHMADIPAAPEPPQVDEASPFGPQYDQPQQNTQQQPQYGQGQYQQPQYDQQQYQQPQYDQQQYQQPQYGQQQYQQPQYGQPQYQQPPYDPNMPPVYQQPIPAGYVPKSKIAAGLLGIFLGSIGVHNFYLGYTGKAVAQLLIAVLTCGMGAAITGIWGLIEGILILTGSISVDGHGVPLRE